MPARLNLDKRKRAINFAWLSGLFHLKESRHKSIDTLTTPVLVSVHVSINRFMVSEQDVWYGALLAGIASHRNDGSYASAPHDAKVHMQLSFLSTDKENLNNVGTSLTKQIDFVLIGEVQSIRDALTRLIQESSSRRFYISGISASIRSHLWYVEVLRKTYHTAHSEQAIPDDKDFTGLFWGAAFLRDSTICPQKDLVLTMGEKSDDGGSVSFTYPTQCYGQPNYIRHNDESFAMFGRHTEYITNHDVDVSYDGRKWFHLFGDYCPMHEPLFVDEIKRRCSQPICNNDPNCIQRDIGLYEQVPFFQQSQCRKKLYPKRRSLAVENRHKEQD